MINIFYQLQLEKKNRIRLAKESDIGKSIINAIIQEQKIIVTEDGLK